MQRQGHTQTKAGLQMLQDCCHQTIQSSIDLPGRVICKVNNVMKSRPMSYAYRVSFFSQNKANTSCISAYINLALLWKVFQIRCSRNTSLTGTYGVRCDVGFNRSKPMIRSLTSIFCISMVLLLTKASNPLPLRWPPCPWRPARSAATPLAAGPQTRQQS